MMSSRHRQPPDGNKRIWANSAIYQRSWILTVAFLDGVSGLLYAVGGSATAPSLVLMAQIMPMRIWGSVLVLVGMLLGLRRHITGGFIGAVSWLMLTATTSITLINGSTVAAGGSPMVAGIAVIHLLIVYGSASGLSSGAKRG